MKKRRMKVEGGILELLGEGQQLVAAGTHSSGVRYQWKDGLPQEIPTLTVDQVNSVWTILQQKCQTATFSEILSSPIVPEKELPETQAEILTEISDEDWHDLRKGALTFLLDKVSENQDWSDIGYGLLSLQKTRPAKQLWLEWSRKAVGYEPGAPEAWWDGHYNQQPRSDYRHLFTLAREKGWRRTSDPLAFPVVTPEEVSNSAGGSPVLDAAPAPLPEKALVQLTAGGYKDTLDYLERIIDDRVFTQGGFIVRLDGGVRIEDIAHSTKGNEISRSPDAMVISQVSKAWLQKCFGGLAVFKRYDAKKQAWMEVSPNNVDHIGKLSELGTWSVLKPIEAVARAPFVRVDGSICDRPGYDSRSRAVYVPSTEYPAIPATPNYSDAQAALIRIRGIFDQFPWKSGDAESAFLSHIFSEASRLAVDRCPMFWYTAPVAGTGKSLLQEMASLIVHGTEPALRPWVGESEEIRKTLFASLMAGDRSILLDNVPTGYKARAPEICAFLTTSTWKDRKLGASEMYALPNRAVMTASGNNVTPVGDLARRSVVIRLDANTEHLAQRVFKIADLRKHVMQHRPQILVDVLTIIRAYLLEPNKPKMPVPLPSFVDWSRFAREPLIWLGLPDPIQTQLDETDDEYGAIGPVFEKLYSHFSSNTFTSADIARLAGSVADVNGELSQMLLNSGCQDPASPLKLGFWIRGERDKVMNGIKLVLAGKLRTGSLSYKLQRIGEDLTV